MSLNKKFKGKLQEAISSNKIDLRLRRAFSTILKSNDSSKLDEIISYHVQAREGLKYDGLNHLTSTFYTGRTNYKTLLDFVSNPNFYTFEGARRLRNIF
ncbi:hypothetical protein HZA97_07040 [Candidatus Woesearchaeota archaeon]|nr:hypothetical protein [Candidatus Woesearchaeota archaeon]